MGGLFSSTTSSTMNPLGSLTSYGSLTTYGLLNPSFPHSFGGNAVCVSGTIDVPVHATATEVLYKGPINNFELTGFITNFMRRDSDTFATSLGGPQNISGTFSIYSKFCVPANSANKTQHPRSVQCLTHGGTLDHTYGDFAPGYSYVDAAATKDYATFSYDRLGAGKSAHPDP
jgi:hypothetical protein